MHHEPELPGDHAIDTRLAARPLRAGRDFTDRTLARLREEAIATPDPTDAELAATPLRVSPGFTDAVIAASRAERRRTIRFRVISAFGVAACLAMVASIALRPDTDTRLARTLAADAELTALAALPSDLHADTTLTGDLASLAELGDAMNRTEHALES